MRILDVELQDVLTNMSSEDLDNLDKSVDYVRYHSIGGISINPFFRTEHLQQAVGRAGRPELSNYIDDDKAISEIKDDGERMMEELSRSPMFPGGEQRSVRSISEESIKYLIRRAKVMNAGVKYVDELKGMSSDELNSIKYDYSKSSEERNQIDPKYGINEFDKYEIKNIMKAKAYAKEMVAKLSKEQFNEIKSKFEKMRNSPVMRYDSASREMEDFVSILFGEKIPVEMTYDVQMVDFAEAFDGREKELEAKKQKSFLYKVKNFFKSFGKKKDSKKALPEGQDTSSNQGERNKFMESISVSQKDSKYQIPNEQSRDGQAQTRTDQSVDDQGNR